MIYQKTLTYKDSEFFDYLPKFGQPSHGIIRAFGSMDGVSDIVAANFIDDADAMLYWLRKGRPSGHDYGLLHVVVNIESSHGIGSPFLYRSYIFDLEQTLMKISRLQKKPLGIFV